MKTDPLVKQLLRNGDVLTDTQLLELLLRNGNEEKAQELAEQLVELYPSISALIEADPLDLKNMEGMDEQSYLLLRLLPEFQRRYFLSHNEKEHRLLNGTAFGRYLLPYFFGARDEIVYLLLLDAGGNVLNCRMLGKGTVCSANVPLRRLVQEALTANASALVLAHNHPCGIAMPSQEDLDLTLRIRDTLGELQLSLLDHIIVADDDFISMRDSGYLREG